MYGMITLQYFRADKTNPCPLFAVWVLLALWSVCERASGPPIRPISALSTTTSAIGSRTKSRWRGAQLWGREVRDVWPQVVRYLSRNKSKAKTWEHSSPSVPATQHSHVAKSTLVSSFAWGSRLRTISSRLCVLFILQRSTLREHNSFVLHSRIRDILNVTAD